eukprot:TRINITY_DN2878_c0_g4_i1.p1 TRINITY_DN2878_c0_g4~~TRINITY_DN2878_c0_g4_i1.p1  ORF type:complete len:665 (-),score=241.89 TRINITY_DN2878_c0_g4_i1:88-2082(-)
MACKMIGLIFLAALLPVSSTKVVFNSGAAEASGRPVTKVVELLQGMQKQVEREGKEDRDTYRDYVCWCKTNGEDKQKAIAFAQEKLPEYQARVEYLQALSKKLVAEYQKIEDETDANKRSLGTATALREEQAKEFDKSKKELDKNLRAIGNAQTTLSSGSFLQSTSARKALLPQLEKLMDASSKLSSEDRFTVTSYLQGQVQGPADAVQGVLNGMKDDFASDLEEISEEEDGNIRVYNDLKEAKDEEIAAGLASIESKKVEKAEADDERTKKQFEIKDMQKVLANDIEFAAEVVAKCKVMDGEYNERVATRTEEIKAIKKAIDVLDSDEAHDSFAASLPKSFLQESSLTAAEQSQRLQQVSDELMKSGRQHDLRLVSLAMRTKLDGFVKVKKAIDDMIKALTAERQGEVKKRDFCIEAFNKNTVAVKAKEAQKADLIAKIETLKNTIKLTQEEIETLEGEIAELKTQLRLAGENREQENFEFEHTIKEQKTTQVLLAKALDVLKGFYGAGTTLAQIHHHEEPVREEPPKFKDYKNNKQSFGVMTMIQQIIADSKALEAESRRGEADATAAYEKFSAETTSSIEAKARAISDKTAAKAASEKDLVQSKSGKAGAEEELDQLAQTKKELEDDCNFLLKNFEMRQTAFGEEMESLATAKNILTGMKS